VTLATGTAIPTGPATTPDAAPGTATRGLSLSRCPLTPTGDDLPLRETTFVVLDLETTGARPATDRITEVGAVKVRGGRVLGELATLVDPGVPVDGDVAALTGIADAMLRGAPSISAVLPSLLSFVEGAVVVAHNAPFDLGFLHAACQRSDRSWPAGVVVDTVRLARAVLDRDEVPDCKLATLARFFDSPVTPDHRALSDARATVEVLHGLLARLGARVRTLAELREHSGRLTSAQLCRRHLADGLPRSPGVFRFRDASGRTLLVGSGEDLREAVRRHFGVHETRTRVLEAVALTSSVEVELHPTSLAASLAGSAVLAAEDPWVAPSRRQRWWLTQTDGKMGVTARSPGVHTRRTPTGPFGAVRPSGAVGPFASRPDAVLAADTVTAACAGVHDVSRIRVTGLPGVDGYLAAARRLERIKAVLGAALLVVARPTTAGGWDIDGLCWGVLVTGERVAAGVPPEPAARQVRDETAAARTGPCSPPTMDQLALTLDHLDHAGLRLVAIDGDWGCNLALRPASAADPARSPPIRVPLPGSAPASGRPSCEQLGGPPTVDGSSGAP